MSMSDAAASGPTYGHAGRWREGQEPATFSPAGLAAAAARFRETAHVVQRADGAVGVAFDGGPDPAGALAWRGSLPPLWPEWLGDRSFNEVHGTRFPYIAGAMANGIATTALVEAMADVGALGFFGAAGLPPERVSAALDRLGASLGTRRPWGANLIHSPNEPDLEEAVAALFLAHDVRRVSASAYMGLTRPLVRYAFTGVREEGGRIVRRNHVFAKISRPEVARHMLAPPPPALLDALVARGELTADEARLARHLPVAEDITVESDSGGHTDNRPLGALFPTIARVRDQLAREHGYTRPIRVGAAGGLGSPEAVAAAFGMGAAYVLTGSVNQACVEAGLSEDGKALLATAGLADVVMAPAADMFEMGVKVQVLSRGTMFGPRALKLYEHYVAWPSLEAMPADVRDKLEKRVLGRPADDIWAETVAFFEKRDPAQLARAARDPKHKMALVFRWYLGLSSRWAIAGDPARKLDYQIWCGPAMGAFNAWTAGTFLAEPAARKAGVVALNLLEGAAAITRAGQLRAYGAPMPPEAFTFAPRPLSLSPEAAA
jgi:trans-AT polyketide synthase/acyltransferase/oxidoreductase domain-containing protein